MTTPTVLAGTLALALVPAGAAMAQKPPKPPKGAAAVSISATPNPVVFGKPVTIDGKLTGASPAGGVTVRLEQDDTRPYGDSYKASGLQVATSPSGAYRFTPKTQKNTQYRVVAQASPPVTSPGRLVSVRPLVGLRVSTQSPRAGRSVRFSGIVQPARNGARVSIQKRSPSGTFVTVKRATLVATTGGSRYSTTARISRSGSYRVKLPGTSELVNGFSRTVALNVR